MRREIEGKAMRKPQMKREGGMPTLSKATLEGCIGGRVLGASHAKRVVCVGDCRNGLRQQRQNVFVYACGAKNVVLGCELQLRCEMRSPGRWNERERARGCLTRGGSSVGKGLGNGMKDFGGPQRGQ